MRSRGSCRVVLVSWVHNLPGDLDVDLFASCQASTINVKVPWKASSIMIIKYSQNVVGSRVPSHITSGFPFLFIYCWTDHATGEKSLKCGRQIFAKFVLVNVLSVAGLLSHSVVRKEPFLKNVFTNNVEDPKAPANTTTNSQNVECQSPALPGIASVFFDLSNYCIIYIRGQLKIIHSHNPFLLLLIRWFR